MADSFLDNLTAEQRSWLMRQASSRTLKAGAYLAHHGDSADSMYVITAGRFAIQVVTANGHTSILRTVGAGELIGEYAVLVADLRRTASIVATMTSTVLVIHRDVFEELRSRWPSIDRALTITMARRLAFVSEQVVAAHHASLGQRITEQLLLLDEVHLHGWIDVTQQVLADMVGGARQSVNEVLQTLRSAGLVELRRGSVKVNDRRALTRFSH